MKRTILQGLFFGVMSGAVGALCASLRVHPMLTGLACGLIYVRGVCSGWNICRSTFNTAGAITDDDSDG